MKKARIASAPGPSGLPYKVYKKCPLLLRRLWKILWTIWANGIIPTSWRVSEGCFVPKEKDPSTISQFRTILLHTLAECRSKDFPLSLGKSHDNLHDAEWVC